MRIYTRAGDMSFELMTFPDGQPHFRLITDPEDDSFSEATIETAIRNPTELFNVLLAQQVLDDLGYTVDLDIRYLMGARMDRAIDDFQPNTLEVVARQLLADTLAFRNIRVLDCHSKVGTAACYAKNVLPTGVVQEVLKSLPTIQRIIIPDKGAVDRVKYLTNEYCVRYGMAWAECSKHRDMQTGKLTGFKVDFPDLVKNQECLIVDDICDGGGTFVGLAGKLREAGATRISLFVTHGIFSKGLPLAGIDRIFCTDSYTKWANMSLKTLTVIPISMKEIR